MLSVVYEHCIFEWFSIQGILRASNSLYIAYTYPLIISFKWENYIPNVLVRALKLLFPHSRPCFSDICLNTCWNEQGWTLPLENVLVCSWPFYTEGDVPNWQNPWYSANTLGWVLRKLAYSVWVYMWYLSIMQAALAFNPNAWSCCGAQALSFAVRAGVVVHKKNCSVTYFLFTDKITGNVNIKKLCWKYFEFLITFSSLFYFLPFFFLIIYTLCNSTGVCLILQKI